MGASESKKIEAGAPIIIDQVDSNVFMLINCDGSEVILEKDVLDQLAAKFNISLDVYKDFPSKCKALRRVIKEKQNKDAMDIYSKRPELSIDVLNKPCSEFARNYTFKEWRDFYNKNKSHFKDWDDIITPDLNTTDASGLELWHLDSTCDIMRHALLNQGLVKGSETEQEQLKVLNKFIQNAREAEAKRKIAEIERKLKV